MWTSISTNTNLEANTKYLVDTSSSIITLTLPVSPNTGSFIIIADSVDWSVNKVVVETTDQSFTVDLTTRGSIYEFIYTGTQWNVYGISYPVTRIPDLDSIPTGQISSNDILLYLNNTSDSFESFKVTYGNLKESITDDSYTSIDSIINDLNTKLNENTEPFLNVKLLDGNEASYYLNYTNLTNKPIIPTSVSQLSNDLGYIVNLDNFTTDNLTEGAVNKYLTEQSFDSFFTPAFNNAFRQASSDFSETSINDSLDNVVATPSTTEIATNSLTVSSSVIDSFQPGQNIRIYGGNIADTSIGDVPLINNVTKNGFSGLTEGELSYKLAQFDFETGKISSSSVQSDTITGFDLAAFNITNNITLSFNRSNLNYGILVYRKLGASLYQLIDILGQKQLGNQTTNIIYTDYGSFNYTPWSKKNATTGIYQSSTGTIHFPLTAPTNASNGWIDALIEEVDLNSNQIILADSYYFKSTVVVVQNDTNAIQTAINQRISSGLNSLILNDRQYIVSSLAIPTQFSLYGKGGATVLKKLPWSTELNNKIIRLSSTSATNVIISNLSIDGNMQNQWLKSDSFDETANYAIDMKTESNTLNVDKLQLSNVIGGGIYARNPNRFLLNLSRIEDSGMDDVNEYSPLLADGGTDVIVTNNVFKNFTSAIDLSVTDNGVFSGNAVQNVGTGVLTFASKFFISSPNVLRGPAGEFIPGPDILNSIYDSINITLETGTQYTSDVYKYQENGIDFDLVANRASLSFRVDKLRKVDNVEELYGEILISGDKPIQRVLDLSLDPTEGEFKFSISQSNVDQLLTTYSYSTLKAAETNHIGLVYSALLTEYVPSGTVSGTPTFSGSEYTVTILNFSNLFVGAKVKMLGHGGTPDLNNLVGTVINIDDSVIANPPEVTVTIDFEETISAVGTGGQITVENTFILAKGRIL